MNVTLVGAGAWGTALGWLASQNGHVITVWGHNPEHLATMALSRRCRQLPDLELPSSWRFESDLAKATEGAELTVVAVPSRSFRGVAQKLRVVRGVILSATKGIEVTTGDTMCEVLEEEAPGACVAAVSGPSLALEVARGVPSAAVVAARDLATAEVAQRCLHRPRFRTYRSLDMKGVELGGALKNVIAIAAGVCDGCGFGDNSKAALITRGIAEMRRIGVACGAQAETFSGLSGLGDLTVTCFSRLSRNRRFGERLGRGEPLEELLRSEELAEGVPTARSAMELARRMGTPAPILSEVHAMIYEGKPVQRAVEDLLGRELKAED